MLSLPIWSLLTSISNLQCIQLHKNQHDIFVAIGSSSIEGKDRRYGFKRQKQFAVCRLQLVPLQAGKLFYFCALLTHKAGYAFEDFQTVDGILYPTFQRAAIELGIFADKNKVERAMKEGILSLLQPGQLWFLFANLIADLSIGPFQAWKQFQEKLIEDFVVSIPQILPTKLCLKSLNTLEVKIWCYNN